MKKHSTTLNGISGNKRAYVNTERIHKPKKPVRILSKDIKITADERSLSNLNCTIIGATGAGKTRSFVSPNISAAENESMIVLDSKLNLYKKHKAELESKGYKVELIDLVDLTRSTIGYNPLDYVRTVGDHGQAKVDDVREIASFIASDNMVGSTKEPFWHQTAREYIAASISLAFHTLVPEEINLKTVNKLLSLIDQPEWAVLIAEAKEDDPECLEVEINDQLITYRVTEKTHASILGIAKTAMTHFIWDEANELYCSEKRIKFSDLGDKKMAVFVNVPDHDFSKGPILSLFFSQCLKELLDHADRASNSRLRHPVHIIADDIASHFAIPHLPELISIIRSRGISLTLVLQSISQLSACYGESGAMTIIGNCSIVAFLGSMELDSPNMLSLKANIPVDKITSMRMTEELLLIQGRKPIFAKKYNAEDYTEINFIDQHEEQPSRDGFAENMREAG